MTQSEFSALVERANSELPASAQAQIVGAKDGETPRFEVYHASFSVCSHKVRTVLLEKGIPFISHMMSLRVDDKVCSDSYLPNYVKMRLRGAEGAALVSGYTGQSSMESEGFDPAVVPTLIDHAAQRVIVDSANICAYLDREASTVTKLIPDAIADAVNAQISLIDEAPHVAVLYGANPKGDTRPEVIANRIEGVHKRKIKHLERLKASVSDDPELVAAYDAKIVKEATAGEFVYNPETMIDAHERMAGHVAALESQLASHDGQWALGTDYTMADIMWTISLFRLKWLGLSHLWEADNKGPNVSEYVKQAFARPAFREAVIDWPMATPPSKHIKETSGIFKNLQFVWQALNTGTSKST